MSQTLRADLQRFVDRLNIPAATAGVLGRHGVPQIEVVGSCRRGSAENVDADAQWHIGSCAKSMTAVVFAKMVEQGLVDWHQSVDSVFPDLAPRISELWQQRTLEELFLCTAGMQANPTKKEMIRRYADRRPLVEQRTDVVAAALAIAPQTPGRFVYSNLSYITIGAAIDRIACQPFEQVLEDLVLKPCGMTTLGYGPPPSVCGHKSRLRLGNLLLLPGPALHPEDLHGDNPCVFSSAGTMHLSMMDWTKFLALFIEDGGDLLTPQSINCLLSTPDGSDLSMAKGWAKARGLDGVSFGMQGSNTLWAATALTNSDCSEISFVVCNDGRSKVLAQSARFAAGLLVAGFSC